ncbi:hypothetical protein IPH67_04615 [bacterium]|nr:MAG: hypothetical protein IPH67_04615 [bacterium]
MSGKGCGYFKAVLFFFAFSIAQVWAGETNEFVFVRNGLNTDFFKQADQIKQFLVKTYKKVPTRYYILTKKGQQFESMGLLTPGNEKNMIFESIVYTPDHDIKMFQQWFDGTAVYLSSNNQLVINNNDFSESICTSTPYKLEILSVTEDDELIKSKRKAVYIVASSWPNIHFVFSDYIKGGWSRLQKTFPRWFKRTNPEKKLAKCTLKNAYLLDVGQEGEGQYIIYAQIQKNTEQVEFKDFFSRLRNIKTDYRTVTIKKWKITKDKTFENICDVISAQNGEIRFSDAEDDKDGKDDPFLSTLCTFQNIPVDGSHVPFVIDYRNDNQWAVVCKKKDGYYLHTNAKSGEKTIDQEDGEEGSVKETPKKLSFSNSNGQKSLRPTLLAVHAKSDGGVTFYCKEGKGELEGFAVNLEPYALDSEDVDQKRTFVGCFTDQKHIYLLFVESFTSIWTNASQGIQKFIVQVVPKDKAVEKTVQLPIKK